MSYILKKDHDFVKKVKDLNFMEMDKLFSKTQQFYNLKNTPYYFSIYFQAEHVDCSWCDSRSEVVIKFEKVLDNVSEEIQTQLLFHLDLFT